MKIAIFLGVPKTRVSGYFIGADNLVRGLNKAGHKVAFVLPSPNDKRTSKFSYRSPLGLWGFPNIADHYVEKLLDKFKPDIIHVHDPALMGIVSLKYAFDYDIPIIFTVHNEYEQFIKVLLPFYLRFWLIPLLTRWIKWYIKLCDEIIVQTPSMIDYILKRGGIRKDIIVQPTGIDLEKFKYKVRKMPENKVSILYVGSIDKRKNVKLLVHMMRYLDRDKYKLSIVGGGFELDKLKRLSEKFNLRNITFYGCISPKCVDMYYKNSDIFVSASYTESQGLVYIEAMASGLPVVALDNLGSRDIIINYKTGVILHKADQKLFAEHIKKITNNKKVYEYYSRNAYKHAQNFDLSNTIPKTVEIYEDTIKNYKIEREREGKISYFNKLISKFYNNK